MYKRLYMLTLVFLVALTSACFKAPTRTVLHQDQQSQTDNAALKTVRLGIDRPRPELDPIIEAFKARHPEYQIDRTALSIDMAKVKQGQVDLVPGFLISNQSVGQGLIASLDPFIGGSNLDLAAYGGIVGMDKFRGQAYRLPVYGNPTVLAYNTELLKAAGVTIPTAWTWDQFRQMAARLTRGSGEDKIWGFAADLFLEDLAYMLALERVPDGSKPDGAAVRWALDFVNSMIMTDHSLSQGIIARPGSGNGTLPMYCAQGRAALCLLPLSDLTQNPAYSGLRLAPMPSESQSRILVPLRLESFGIAAKAPQADVAWTFLKFLAGPEGASILAHEGRFPVYNSEAVRQAWLESSPQPPAGSEGLFNVSWYLQPEEYSPESPQGTFFYSANGLFGGEGAVDAAVREYEAALGRAK